MTASAKAGKGDDAREPAPNAWTATPSTMNSNAAQPDEIKRPSSQMALNIRDDEIRRCARSLSPAAIAVWHMENAAATTAALLCVAIVFHNPFVDVDNFWLAAAITGCIVSMGAMESVFLIPRRFRFYKYALLAEYFVVARGNFISSQFMMPYSQMLYLEVRQNPILRRFGLFRIRIGSIAEAHTFGPFDQEAVAEFQQAAKGKEG